MSNLGNLAIIASVAALDQIVKFAVENGIRLGGSRHFFGGYLKIRPVYNSGGAFGIFAHRGEFFTGFSILMICLLIASLFLFDFKFYPAGLGLSFMAGGALGNLIDRLRNGAVTDFVQIGKFPIFNLADAVIVIGAGLIITSIFLEGKNVQK